MKDRIDSIASLKKDHFTILLDSLSGLSIQGSTYEHPLFHTYSLTSFSIILVLMLL